MKVQLLASSTQDPADRQFVSTYLINDAVAVDAGSLGFHGTPREQAAVRHVFLTHSHSDHTASLPIFIENVWTPTPDCPRIYGNPETLDSVQRHIFNDVMWPHFIALSRSMPPFLELCPLRDEVPVKVAGLWVTPVRVNHLVPTNAYVISDGRSSVILAGDSGPTKRVWEVAYDTPDLRAVFLEACFPNSVSGLAQAALHLTPELFCREVSKMPAGVKVIAVHIKVRYRDQVIRELLDLRLPDLEIGECGKEYEF